MEMTMARADGARAPVAESPDMRELIDLRRYPLDRPASAEWRTLVERGRAAMAAEGVMVLDGFLTAPALEAIRADARAAEPKAFFKPKSHNAYLMDQDPDLPADHPRNRLLRTDVATIADDGIPADSLIRPIYGWSGLRGFLAAVIGVERLYPYDDPLASINFNVGRPGAQLSWHLDAAEFTTTIMLQPAATGGAYEYVPFIRSEMDMAYDRVGRLLDGDRAGVRVLEQKGGTLVLFRGHHSIHRVTTIEGATTRNVAILSYDPQPGRMLLEHARRTFYGRPG